MGTLGVFLIKIWYIVNIIVHFFIVFILADVIDKRYYGNGMNIFLKIFLGILLLLVLVILESGIKTYLF